jgi:uncharacterized Zn finger protein
MESDSPFAYVLHRETIARLATSAALERGRRYAAEQRVETLSAAGTRLTAEVRGSEVYRISIWVNGDRLGYVCTCPQGADGNFCKHCVAVAIAWVESRARS